MNAIDEMKKRIEETREELNKLVLTGNYENYCGIQYAFNIFINNTCKKYDEKVAYHNKSAH